MGLGLASVFGSGRQERILEGRRTGKKNKNTHMIAELLGPLLEGAVTLSRHSLGLDDRSKRDRVVHAVDSPALPFHLLPHGVRLLDAVLQHNFLGKLRVSNQRQEQKGQAHTQRQRNRNEVECMVTHGGSCRMRQGGLTQKIRTDVHSFAQRASKTHRLTGQLETNPTALLQPPQRQSQQTNQP